MKLYDFTHAPNPYRVRMVLAEKGVELPLQTVDIMKGEHMQPEYRAIAPNARVPALVLDDGTVLQESIAICRYIESLHPEPNLFGTTALELAQIEMWTRKMEYELVLPMAMAFRHTNPAMAALEKQVPEYGEVQREVALRRLKVLNKELAERDWIVAGRFTIADIAAFSFLRLFGAFGFKVTDEQPNLSRWFSAIKSRPSAAL